MKKLRRLSKRLLLILIILLVCLGVIEVLARLVLGNEYPMNQTDPETLRQRLLNQQVSSRLFQCHPDERLCYELKPGSRTTFLDQHYTVNTIGLRGPEVQKEKPEGTFRVALTGDSFVFGWGADDTGTISAYMQDILTRCDLGGRRYEILNCGVPGYHAGQMKEHLKRKIFPIDPDLLILVVTANDLVKECLHFDTLFEGLYTDFLPLPYAWKPFLWRTSVAYRFMVMRHKAYVEGTGRVGGFTDADLTFFQRQVKTIKAEAEERNIGFMLVMLPMLENFSNYPYEKQHQDMHQRLEGFDLVDLTPRMRAYDVRDLWFHVSDHHLNNQANLAVARMILGELEARNFIRLKQGTLPEEPLMQPRYRSGDYIVVDADADPLNRGNFPGALFRLSPDGKEMNLISSDPLFCEPLDLIFDQYGNLLVVDSMADPLELGNQGAIFRVNRYSGRAEVLLSSEKFGFPNALIMDSEGRIYISDKEADPHGLGKSGTLWVYDSHNDVLDLVVSGPEFISPSPIVFGPDDTIYLIDADANPNSYPGTPGVLYQIDRFTGEHAPLVTFNGTVSPVGIIPLDDGRLVVIDANADPLKTGFYLGGLVMVDPAAGTYEFLYGTRKFMDPIRGDLDVDGTLIFTDSSSDPLKLGRDGARKGVEGQGHGAVWRFNLKTKELSLVAADVRFVNPMSVKRVP